MTVRCAIPPGGKDCEDPVCGAIGECKEGVVCELCVGHARCIGDDWCYEFDRGLGLMKEES